MRASRVNLSPRGRREDLDGDLAVQGLLDGLPDNAHAAAPELALEGVVAAKQAVRRLAGIWLSVFHAEIIPNFRAAHVPYAVIVV